MSAEHLARATADAMWAQDEDEPRGLGMAITEIAPGFATLTMTVTDKMVNGHGLCHGGYIFTLADSAFAFACNTTTGSAPSRRTAAITYVAPGRPRRQAHGALPEEVRRAAAAPASTT